MKMKKENNRSEKSLIFAERMKNCKENVWMVISFPIVVVFVRCRVFPVQSIDVKAALKPRNSGITQMNCLVYAVAVVVAVATADKSSWWA